MTIEKLSKLHAEIVSKSYYDVQITALKFWHKEIYNEELNTNCSSCIVDSYNRLKRYYHAQIAAINTSR